MSFSLPQPLAGVLFDLDGTLVDSAADLYRALQALCAEAGGVAPPLQAVRQVVSSGASAIVRGAFPGWSDAQLAALMPRYLEIYRGMLDGATRTFDGVDALLDALDAHAVPWAIVTNKAEFLSLPLLHSLGLAERAAAIVCGDTLSTRKPDPAPVLHACALAKVAPSQCVFVGDDVRDIQAGHRAGMPAIAAAWGYWDAALPDHGGADAVPATPYELAALLHVA
ncbi:MAG: HAD-IA family hydrolase [Xanthomonadales bacterium]|nr:HAD-IA family hydrolase [Xanthomonadales bacterium]